MLLLMSSQIRVQQTIIDVAWPTTTELYSDILVLVIGLLKVECCLHVTKVYVRSDHADIVITLVLVTSNYIAVLYVNSHIII